MTISRRLCVSREQIWRNLAVTTFTLSMWKNQVIKIVGSSEKQLILSSRGKNTNQKNKMKLNQAFKLFLFLVSYSDSHWKLYICLTWPYFAILRPLVFDVLGLWGKTNKQKNKMKLSNCITVYWDLINTTLDP